MWGEEKLRQVGGSVMAAKTAGAAGSAMTGVLGAAAEAVKNAARRAA